MARVAAFLPPETRELLPMLAARNARRARRLVVTLRPSPTRRRTGAPDPLGALAATLDRLRGGRRLELLCDPGMRAWLTSAEEAVALSDESLSDVRLFDRLTRGAHLARVMPHGRIDGGFRARVSSLGAKLTERALLRLPPLLAFRTPPDKCYGPFPLDLAPDGEEGRSAGEIRFLDPAPFTMRLPAAARLELAPGGIRVRHRGRAAELTPAELISGSGIVLARRVMSTRRGLRSGPRVPDAGLRLAEALDLLARAWPHGHREVLAHTRMVVPLLERGTVSFSFPDRPGVSYINLEGKTRVDLADDLLHETAHHRLHGLEEPSPLIRAGGGADEPRYWSAWRRSLRPLRGILHAAYTFAWRAELLARLGRLPCRLPRAWMVRQLDFEIASLHRAVADLEDATRRGLLTLAGDRLARAIGSRVSELSLRSHRQRG